MRLVLVMVAGLGLGIASVSAPTAAANAVNVTVSHSTAPGPVSSLKVTAATASSVSLSWVNPTSSSLAGVMLRRAKGTKPPSSPTAGTLVAKIAKPGAKYKNTGLAPSTTYSYTAFAYNSKSQFSAGVHVTTTTAPSPVTALKVTGVTTTSVSLTWTDPVSVYTSVVIRRATGAKAPSSPTAGTLVANVARPGATVTDTKLSASTTYSYAVFAVNSAARYSTATDLTATTAPNPVTALKITGITTSSLALSWTNPAGAFTGVVIRRALGTTPPATPTSGTLVATVTSHGTSFTDSGLSASATYSYAIFAYNSASEFSVGVDVTGQTAALPPPVTSLKVTAVTGSTVSLSWVNPASTNLTGVMIRRAQGSAAPSSPTSGTLVTKLAEPGKTSYTDIGLTGSTTYSYAIFSSDSTGDFSVGTDVTGTTSAANAPGCTTTWTGAASSSWTNAANWSGAAVPGPSDWACIPADLPHLPVSESGTKSVLGLTNDGGLVINGSLTLTAKTPKSVSTGMLELAGSLTVGGTLSVKGQFDAGGTINGPGTVTVMAGATLTVGDLSVESGALVNAGTASIPANGALFIEAGVTFTNSGTLSLGQRAALSGGCANAADPVAGRFTNSGTLTASGSAANPAVVGDSSCLVTDSTGTIDISSGMLDLSGTVTIGSGSHLSGISSSVLEIDGQVTVDSSASIAGPSTIDVEDTLTTLAALSVPTLIVNGTTLGGGNWTVTSALTGSGSLDGTGTLTVAASATMTSSDLIVGGGTMINDGSATIPASDALTVEGGAAFTNAGQLRLGGDSVLSGDCFSQNSPGAFANSGTVTIAASASFPARLGDCMTTRVSGTINVSSGTLFLSGSTELTSGGRLTGTSSTLLDLTGDLTLDAGAAISGSSPITVQGTLSTTPSLSLPELTLTDSAIVTGTGNVTVTTALSGTGSFTGSGVMTVATGATMTSTDLTFSGGSLVNDGTASVPGSLFIGSGITFANNGTVSLGPGSELDGGCAIAATPTSPAVPAATFENLSTVTSAGTAAEPAEIGYNNRCIAVNDTGTINVTAGELDLGGENFALASGSNLTGAATAALDIAGELDLDAGATLSGPHTITIEGTLSLRQALSMPTVHMASGTIQGAGNLTVTSALDGSGEFAGPGTVTVTAGATLTSTALVMAASSLVNHGTASIPASDELTVQTGATFTNTATLNLGQNSRLGEGCAEPASPTSPAIPAGELDNSGTITATASANFPAVIGDGDCGVLMNDGSINVTAGTLSLETTDMELNSGSAVTGASSAVLDLGSGLVDVNTGATVSGPPTITVEGALSTAIALTIPTLTLAFSEDFDSFGTVQGSGNITVTSALSGTGFLKDTGTITVAAGATMTSTELLLNDGTLVNDGTVTIPADDTFSVDAGATFNNTAAVDLGQFSVLDGGCQAPTILAGTFNNNGTVTVAASATFPASLGDDIQDTNFNSNCLTINDNGTIDITAGELDLGGPSTQLNSGSQVIGAASAVFAVASGGTVDVNTGATISGPQTIADHGTLTTHVALTVPDLVMGGDLGGTGNVTVTSALTGGATFTGPDNVTVAAGATMTTGDIQIDGGSVINDGTATFSSGQILQVQAGATFVNKSALNLNGSELWGACAIPASQSSPPIPAGDFQNLGTITAVGGSGSVDIGGVQDFDGNCLTTQDSGIIDVASGGLTIGGTDFELESGSQLIGSSSPLLTGGSVAVDQGAVISGLSSIEAIGQLAVRESITLPAVTLSSGATLDLGASVIVHTSSFSIPINGTLQLDSAAPGQFGQLIVSGSAALSSQFDVNLNAVSYTPACGTTLTTLTAGAVSGSLFQVFGTVPSGGTWAGSVTSTAVTAVLNCPTPSTPQPQTYGAGSSADAVNPAGYFAEPVNTATGAYSTTETDASLPGIGVPFRFVRYYTSPDPYTGPLGPGWTDSMNVFLSGSPQSNVTLSSENGQQTVFNGAGNGTYSAPAGVHSVLTDVSGGGWLLVRHNSDHLLFDAAGHLISETDRNGVGLTFSYSPSGQLASVTDFAGRTVSFSYNASGLLSQMSFPPGRTVSYSYNGSGELTSVTDAAGGTTSYSYDPAGPLATITDQNGHQVVANTYDSDGRVISQVNALGKTATFSYDNSTQTCTYTDPNGHQWQDVYAGNVLVKRIDPLGDATSYYYDSNLDVSAITDPNGNTTTMSYDTRGNLLSRTAPFPISATQTWTYDAINDVTSYTDGDGHTTTYSYDAHGNLLSRTRPDGSTVTWTRDATTGLPTTMTDERGHATSYGYDAAGELTSVTSPLGEHTTYTYDAAGRLTSTVSPRGNATSYGYDALDNLTAVTNADTDTTAYTYDAVGDKTSVTDPDGNTTSYGYNADNELASVTAPGSAVTSYGYDAAGHKTSVTDPDGDTTTFGYDQAGRLVTLTNPLGKKTTYGYDASGNQTSITDAVGAVTTKTYDAENRLVSVSYSDGTPAVTFGYDASGNRLKMTDGTGTTNYTYNSRNELTAVTGPQGNYGYGYDPSGNVTSRTYPGGRVITYTYDSDQRVSSVTADSATTTLGYNADSELATISYPNGYSESASYDPAGLVSSISDKAGLSTLTSFAYGYDAAGNPTTVTTPAQADTYSYDSRNWLTGVCYGVSCANGSISYSYDQDGNRTSETTGSGTTTYAYNKGDELVSITAPSGTTTDSYDADGRLVSAGPVSYGWNAAGQLTSWASGAASIAFGYDGDGNRVTTTTSGVTTSASYDVNNPLPLRASESSGGGEVRSYVWSAGLLLAMRTSGNDFFVAHDEQGSVAALTSSTGATESEFGYDPFGALRSVTKIDPNAPAIPLAFESQYLDGTGGYQLRAREMNPATGAFLSPDPATPTPSYPAISPYIYADDQPGVLGDPTGQTVVTDVLGQGLQASAISMLGDTASTADTVLTGVLDAWNLGTNCGQDISNPACERAIEQAAVDVAVTTASALLVPGNAGRSAPLRRRTRRSRPACPGHLGHAGASDTCSLRPQTPRRRPTPRRNSQLSLAPMSLGLWHETHSDCLSGSTQLGVQRGQRDAFALRQHEVGGVICSQRMMAADGDHGSHIYAREVNEDRKLAEQRHETSGLRLGQVPAALTEQQDVGYLQLPQRRDYGGVVREQVENRLSLSGRLVFEAPRQRHRRIDDERHSAPSLADQVGQ